MLRCVKFLGVLVVACALACVPSGISFAGTIIRLGLGSDDAPDIQYNKTTTTLSTADDGVAGTTEDQNTNVDFQGFAAAIAADIPTTTASFSLDGLIAAPLAEVFNAGTLVLQNFTGGTFMLRDAANNEILSGNLGASSITGPLGGTGTGGLFTTTFSSANPGTPLGNIIKPNSLTLSMSFTNVLSNGALGFALQPIGSIRLESFTGDVTINIGAEDSGAGEWNSAAAGTGNRERRHAPGSLKAIERVDPARQLLPIRGREIAGGIGNRGRRDGIAGVAELLQAKLRLGEAAGVGGQTGKDRQTRDRLGLGRIDRPREGRV